MYKCFPKIIVTFIFIYFCYACSDSHQNKALCIYPEYDDGIDSILHNKGGTRDVYDYLLNSPQFASRTPIQHSGSRYWWKTSADGNLRITSLSDTDNPKYATLSHIVQYSDDKTYYVDSMMLADSYGIIDTIYHISTKDKIYYFPLTKMYHDGQGEYHTDNIHSLVYDKKNRRLASDSLFRTNKASYSKICVYRHTHGAALPIDLDCFEVIKFNTLVSPSRVVIAVFSEETGWPTGHCLVYEWTGKYFKYVGKELYIPNFYD